MNKEIKLEDLELGIHIKDDQLDDIEQQANTVPYYTEDDEKIIMDFISSEEFQQNITDSAFNDIDKLYTNYFLNSNIKFKVIDYTNGIDITFIETYINEMCEYNMIDLIDKFVEGDTDIYIECDNIDDYVNTQDERIEKIVDNKIRIEVGKKLKEIDDELQDLSDIEAFELTYDIDDIWDVIPEIMYRVHNKMAEKFTKDKIIELIKNNEIYKEVYEVAISDNNTNILNLLQTIKETIIKIDIICNNNTENFYEKISDWYQGVGDLASVDGYDKVSDYIEISRTTCIIQKTYDYSINKDSLDGIMMGIREIIKYNTDDDILNESILELKNEYDELSQLINK